MIKFKHILLFFVFIFGFTLNGLCDGYGNPEDQRRVPLDGGVSVLIVAGVAYGAKKYRDYRMNKKEDQPQNSK